MRLHSITSQVRTPQPNTTCRQCGTLFYIRPGRVAAGEGKFCSHLCYWAYWRSATTFAERFWSHVAQSETCWVWTLSCEKAGYGQFQRNGAVDKAHRIAYELTYGPIPNGMCVLHTCDNPPCCNPAHLFTGTHTDNMRDMIRKGRERHQPGVAQSQAKLTDAKVVDIRARYRPWTVPYRMLAEEYDVCIAVIRDVVKCKKWTHVL